MEGSFVRPGADDSWVLGRAASEVVVGPTAEGPPAMRRKNPALTAPVPLGVGLQGLDGGGNGGAPEGRAGSPA